MKKWKLLFIAALFTAGVSAQPLTYTISTVAGGSTAFDFAEGKPATTFLIPGSSTPAADRQGNFYFSLGHRVVRVGTDGIARTYAGTGQAGFIGDNGPASSARLNGPGNLLFDPQDRLIVFDAGNNRIRRVEINGNITTIAGNGQLPTTSTDGDGGPAILARVNAIIGAYDKSGNLFIVDNTDFLNSVFNVRRIDTNGRIATVARDVGIYPGAIASDGTNIYLGDFAGRKVTRVGSNGALTVIAGTGFVVNAGNGGPASAASFGSIGGMACDSAGNLHIVDTNEVRTIRNNPPGAVASGQGIISPSAGTGVDGFGEEGRPASTSLLSNAQVITVDAADNIYISDSGSGRFRRFRINGTMQTVAGLLLTDPFGDGGPASQALLVNPQSLSRDAAGNLLIADGARLRQISPDGLIATIVGRGIRGTSGDNGPAAQALLSFPLSEVQDSAGNLYVLDLSGTVRKITPDRTISTVLGFAGATQDEGPAAKVGIGFSASLAVDAQDSIYVGSQKAVRKMTPAGMVTRVAGTNTFNSSPLASGDARSANIGGVYGLALDANSNLFLTDTFYHRMLKVTPAGQFTTVAGTYSKGGFSGDGGPAAQALLNRPAGLTFDAWGNLYFSDQLSSSVRKIAPDGTISTIAGSLSLSFFQGQVADPAGNIFLINGKLIGKLTADKLRAAGVLHAATVTAGPVVAGLRIFIRGTELIPPGVGSDALSVLFDGRPAGFVSIDGSQIVTVVPAAVAGQTSTQTQVQIRGASTNALSLPVVAALPGILGIQNADGSVNGDSAPAASGSTIVVLVTGDGNADPSAISVLIGGVAADILDASPVDSTPGVRGLTVQLPDGTADGSTVVVAVGGASSQDGVTIRVQ